MLFVDNACNKHMYNNQQKREDPGVHGEDRFPRCRCCILTPPFRVEVLGAHHDRVGALIPWTGLEHVTRKPEGSVDRRNVNTRREFRNKSNFFVN